MPPGSIEAAKREEERLASIQVLNTQMVEMRADVAHLKGKLDEALLIGARISGYIEAITQSIGSGVKALCVIAGVVVLFAMSHTAFIEVAVHAAGEWFKHAIL